jgi:alkylation response protein AidB-like acyl-CoA dehydrogenase
MNKQYSHKQNTIYSTYANFAKTELNNSVFDRDKSQTFGQDEWHKCGEKKLHGISIPEFYGGLGCNALDTSIILESLGYGCEDGGLIFSLSAQLLSCTIPIWLHGTEEQKNRYLPLLSAGKMIAANAITEKKAGSDVFSMHTKAVKSSSSYILNGEKSYISNAPNSNIVLLYAATDSEKGFYGGISAFIIDKATPGLLISNPIDKMGLRTCMMGNIELNNVEVLESNHLGKVGAGGVLFIESMNWERALLSAIHVGTMVRILEKSIHYLNSRKIGEDTIGKYQTNSHKIAEMYTLIETSRLLVHKAANEIDHKSETTSLSASTAKLFVSEALNKVCDMALLIFGANGYLTQSSIERYKRDAVAAQIYSGTNDVQKNIISKWLGV